VRLENALGPTKVDAQATAARAATSCTSPTTTMAATAGPASAFESPTFDQNVSIAVDDEIGAASISPAGRDVVLASKTGLRIIDLDNPYTPPLFIPNQSSWDVADVQWSPFAVRSEWIASTRNQLALVYNLAMAHNSKKAPIEYTLRAHDRAITDINFSAHHPELLATCGIDSFVFVHDLRSQRAPLKLADFTAGATQVKWNRQNDKIIASAHDKHLHIWDVRRGATPLATIVAHSTKIYGIDWNRSDPAKLLTCSLDSTIKLWNNVGKTAHNDTPRRVIQTQYPVWRARHTPFPHGILAMPQRGNSNLWLYKHVRDCKDETFTNNPVHSFQGHEPNAQVREFLWRARGSTSDGLDERDFQLVSWGTDKQLHLHRIAPDLLQNSLGFQKGDTLLDEPCATRRGAAYITYRNGPASADAASLQDDTDVPRHQTKGNLSTLLQNYTPSDDIYALRRNGRIRTAPLNVNSSRETMTATPIRRTKTRVITQITWMDGVKFGEHHDKTDHSLNRQNPKHDEQKKPYQEQNDLGAEISYVGNKYKKLNFESIDVPGRRLTVTFNGPWGDYDENTEDLKLVFLRLTIKFPAVYPKAVERDQPGTGSIRILKPLDIEFEKTTAAISRENQDELTENMNRIAEACAEQEREALEAVLSYALGERGFQDSLHLPDGNQSHDDTGLLAGAESSSEDDDENEGEFTNDAMQSSHTNANVPIAVQCSVRFSASGSLVVARVPLVKFPPLMNASPFRIARNVRNGPKHDIFDSFGRIGAQHADDSDGASSPTSSVASWESSSAPSSSSGSDHVTDAHVGVFQPSMAWQKATSRFQSRHSLPSSSGAAKPVSRNKFIISILSSAVNDLIPSKRVLAEEYRIFGPGPEVCEHNSEVARKHGYEDLADIWMLCKLILNNEVPLEILPQQHRREQVVVLARRALVRIKRKDSGLDLQFDESDNVASPRLKGRIKWGNHAVVTWVIPAIFDYFERLADTQMLAMLSCIFAEPAAREGVTSAMAKIKQSQLPMSMEAPAFSLDYFPSVDVAWSMFKPTISIPSTPSNELGLQNLVKDLDTYGSHGSSNGPWGSDTVASEPVTPYSTGNTPPILSRTPTLRGAHTTTHTPYSTSPEQTHATFKRSSTANFASAVAALSRPFANAMSSSPPVRSRIDDLSTSAPTSGVTWGITTFYGSGTQEKGSLAPSSNKHGKRSSFGQADPLSMDELVDSDSDYDKFNDDTIFAYDGASDPKTESRLGDSDKDTGGGRIRISLKNQDRFDDEACLSRPLLDMGKDWLYRAWREQYAEMLSGWKLISTRAEVLKFNGLVSYFPPERSRNNSRAGSMYLSLKTAGDESTNRPLSKHHMARSSTTLMPPLADDLSHVKRSPATSPRHFSFNPEAREFEPGTGNFIPTEEFPPLSETTMASEKYLHLSIPTPSKEVDESVANLGTSPGQTSLQPHRATVSSVRPSLSRGTSNVSGSSIWASHRVPSAAPTSGTLKPTVSEPIYSCSICWIRVCGRFRLCPACGHVAHFDCVDDDLGMDEGECVVGCGCGCGLEIEDERTRMEAYIDEVRAATATGVDWDERSEWMQLVPADRAPSTPSAYSESMFSDFSWRRGVSKLEGDAQDKRNERLRGPTPSTAKKKGKGKGKKKVRASGLSYY
jgi:hypothetical protein